MINKAKLEVNIKGINISSSLSISHLLFVYEILIFESGSTIEWSFYHDLVMDFCNVLGMSINTQKYILLKDGGGFVKREEISSLFEVQVHSLSDGTRLVGYYIKPNRYRA